MSETRVKRYTYRSFKERLDSIKIEPTRRLQKRAFDETETSHLLASIERGKEFNRSAVFTNFADAIEPLSQSLVQIIYHKKEIFQIFVDSISKHDILSLEPLLEALAQFCHDLGPDFMEFYEQTILLLKDAALKKNNDPSALEWEFNCLAFIFKYLSRVLSKDLLKTFQLLFPLFSSRDHVSRFAAEALSFLIRKSTTEELKKVTSYAFQSLKEDGTDSKGVVICYTQAISSTQGSIHSKSESIIQTLLEQLDSSSSAGVFCDVLLQVIIHGSAESIQGLYSLVVRNALSMLNNNKNFFKSYVQILITLVFAESGKKITDWTSITSSIEVIFQQPDITENSEDLIVKLLSLFVRNCTSEVFTKFHPGLYRFAVSSLGQYFFAFIRATYDLAPERSLRFSAPYIQEFINKNHSKYGESIASFIRDFSKSDILSREEEIGKFNVVVPTAFADSLFDQLRQLELESSKDLYQVYWRFIIISYARSKNAEVTKHLLTKVESLDDHSQFKDIVLSQIVVSLGEIEITRNFIAKLYKNILFVKGFPCHFEITAEYVELFSVNLLSSDHDLRAATLAVLNRFQADPSLNDIINKCSILEEVPLVFNNSRDIQTRLRNLFASFTNLDRKTDLVTGVLYRFVFGFLSSKFAPIWQSILEGLSSFDSYNPDLLWSIINSFITGSQETREFVAFIAADELDELSDFRSSDARLNKVLDDIKVTVRFYTDKETSLIEDAEASHGLKEYPQFMRGHSFKALKLLRNVADKHQTEVVSLLLDSEEEPITIDEIGIDQTDNALKIDEIRHTLTATSKKSKVYGKHLVELLELFAGWKKLKKVTRADEIFKKSLSYLSSKDVAVRKAALNVLFNFHNQSINKYKDNFVNMLDDVTFRDEITKLLSHSEDSSIEREDEDTVMDLVLRILLGKIQTNDTSGHKKGFKTSAILIMTNLEIKHIEKFLHIMSETVSFTEKLEDIGVPSADYLRMSLAYSRALTKVIDTLGEKFKVTLLAIINPLLCTMLSAQAAIDNLDLSTENDIVLQSLARNVRQVGFKNLSLLFNVLYEFSWDKYFLVIYERLLLPRFSSFEDENLQQVTSLLSIISSWSQHKSYHELLLINDLEPSRKVLLLLSNINTKPIVLNQVINFCSNIVKNIKSSSAKYKSLLKFVSKTGFDHLPFVLENSTDFKVNINCIDLLLTLVQHGFIDSQQRRADLISLSTQLLEKPAALLSKDSRLQVLTVLKSLIVEYEGTFMDIQRLWDASSKHLKTLTDRSQRELLIELFVEFGNKFTECADISRLIVDMNAFSKKGMNEFDYDVRLAAYRSINDSKYSSFALFEWLPVLNNALFFITDESDFSIRTNASYTLRRFVDALTEDREMLLVFKNLLLPTLRSGLRVKSEEVQTEYIMLLSHIVKVVTVVDDFSDMKALLFDGDEEANFFNNVNHIQLYRRQQAMKGLGEVAPQLLGSNIAHYILPMIEHYAYVEDEKFRNIGNDTIMVIEKLIGCVSYKQFMGIFKRYLTGLKDTSTTIRDSVKLVVTLSKAFLVNNRETEDLLEGLPTDEEALNAQIETDMIAPISAVLNKRNEETIEQRAPLIEALASFIMCLSHDRIVSVLPGVLTGICQVLRSRADSIRDSIRKHLSRASNIVGPKYTRFIIAELKTALARGFQVHVLGFTIHTILVSMDFQLGDLDESAELLMHIVMENLFGSTGQEKEADGYKTTMKEVKNNKSYDIAEILGRHISLNKFNTVIQPLKMLLKERITAKIQNKIDELIRRISLGLLKNPQLGDHDMLVLCHEIFTDSETKIHEKTRKEFSESEKHFLVQLDAKPQQVVNETKIYTEVMQRLSLDLLRTTLSRNENFVNSADLKGFLQFFDIALRSESEFVAIAALRVLMMIINLDFDSEIDVFKTCARKCLNIIKNSPSTDSELVQACYKYLSTVLRHREDLALKETSLGYLLIRIQSDINSTSKQGIAFNFIKALVSKHVMIPEVYDTMDNIREVMVTSHSKERRDSSRSIYYQFIMEYDQGRGRLEKQFKFLVDNLGYPAESGKQSVLEFIHLILQKSGPQILSALSSSFFVGLSKVLISDTSAKTKEMAVSLITVIFEKQGADSFDKYISGWMSSKNSSLLRCSFQLYSIRLKVSGVSNTKFDEEVLANIQEVLESSKSDTETSVQWELLYSSLNCLSTIVDLNTSVVTKNLLNNLLSTLLFPHSWIRLSTNRLMNVLITKDFLTPSDIQNASSRMFHQMRAPGVDKGLTSQAIKFLMRSIIYWETNDTMFDVSLKLSDESEDNEEEQTEASELKMTDWALKQLSYIIRFHKTSQDAKRSSIQLLAMSIQALSAERILELLEMIIQPLYALGENVNQEDGDSYIELQNLAIECLKLLEEKTGVSNYTQAYSNVRSQIMSVRQERRTQRARLAITAPDVAARAKHRKHDKAKEKRKRERDENGYYHTKKKRTLR